MNCCRAKYPITFFCVLIMSLSCGGGKKSNLAKQLPPAKNSPPEWVQKHPTGRLYYVGIAMVQKRGDVDYIQMAKDAALNNLAAQITVDITGTIDQTIIESSGMVEDEFKRHISTSTKAELEGFELVDTWEDHSNYWVYYRLNKTLYTEMKLEKQNRAINLSLDLFTKARTSENQHNIEKALQFYFQSLIPLENHIGEPLEAIYDGSKIYMFNEIYSSIQSLLSRIELKPVNAKVSAKIGQPLAGPLEISATYKGPGGDSGISNLPLAFSFIRGSGDLVGKVMTDNYGKGKCRISKIKAVDQIQMVEAVLDINSIISLNDASPIVQGIVNGFPLPRTHFELNVSGITAHISSTETHFAGTLDVLSIEPELKKGLSENGFSFVKNKQDADYTITIKALSRQGSEIMGGMYSSFVDVSIFVYDNLSGSELYKRSLHNIKGIDLNFDKAGRKAFANAGERVRNEIVYDLLATIQR